ncbi:hypothetical protein quinque_001165 [Culex quinquefasciatus]
MHPKLHVAIIHQPSSPHPVEHHHFYHPQPVATPLLHTPQPLAPSSTIPVVHPLPLLASKPWTPPSMGPGAGGRHPAEQFYAGARGDPLSCYSGQMAQGAASAEAAHRMAAQLSALIAAQGSMGEARAQAQSDITTTTNCLAVSDDEHTTHRRHTKTTSYPHLWTIQKEGDHYLIRDRKTPNELYAGIYTYDRDRRYDVHVDTGNSIAEAPWGDYPNRVWKVPHPSKHLQEYLYPADYPSKQARFYLAR